jgi:hypothetical protein
LVGVEKSFSNVNLEYFYNDFELRNPLMCMLLMILTLGFYFIYWIYQINEKLSELDDDSPDPTRGMIILLILPITWAFFVFIFKFLIFSDNLGLAKGLEITGWSIIIFLSMQYLYEFCVSFGRITRSSGLVWYLFMYVGYFSVVLLLFSFYYTIPLIIFPFFTLPAMQGFMNEHARKVALKQIDYNFNSRHRAL